MNNKVKIMLLIFGAFILVISAIFFYDRPGNITTPSVEITPRETFSQQEKQILPAEIIDLTSWKVTLPVLIGNGEKKPLDIQQPELATFSHAPWFEATKDRQGVVFRAPVNAPTTKNSDYPRSELREMSKDGKNEIFWPSEKGIHSLFIEQAITSAPKNKPAVVAGQIHGDDDDLLVIRLEDGKLYITRSKQNLYILDDNYELGRRFVVKFVAKDGKIAVYYNNAATPVYVLEKKVQQAYFKAGVYTQSNCETEESVELCNAENYGEVIIYAIEVKHE